MIKTKCVWFLRLIKRISVRDVTNNNNCNSFLSSCSQRFVQSTTVLIYMMLKGLRQ